MDKQKKRLMLTVLIVAIIQMPQLALTPGINLIKTTAFTEYSLGAVQTALSFASLAQPVSALTAAMLINRQIVSKKSVIVFGLALLSGTGVLAIAFHTEFWHLVMLNIVLGISTGCFISNMFGIIFDNFNPQERQVIAGYQTSFINAGGIAMSLLGGLLAAYIWYGGYLVLFVGIPAAILVALTVTKYKPSVPAGGGKKPRGRIDPMVYYYSTVAFLFMMTYSVCGANISTHISGFGGSSLAGVAVAIQMGGGVVSGFFFSKLTRKLGDFALAAAICAVFLGYMLLSVFASSLPVILIAVFLVGMSLSIVAPRCIFMVSMYAVDPSVAATATALVTILGPSMGGFLSPIIMTNITTALFGESTRARYAFVGFVELAFAAAIFMLTIRRSRKTAVSVAV